MQTGISPQVPQGSTEDCLRQLGEVTLQKVKGILSKKQKWREAGFELDGRYGISISCLRVGRADFSGSC